LKSTFSLFIDDKGHKTYVLARNDERLNIHNVDLLSIWRANVDCQPILSRHVVLEYISKYVAKAETRSESYRQMLSRLSQSVIPEAPTVAGIRKLLTETIADRDIGAQEICHMLQKLPLSLCNHTFRSLNVNRAVFRCVSQDIENPSSTLNFIVAYMNRLASLESLPLLEAARSWSYSAQRRKNQWKHIFPSNDCTCLAPLQWHSFL